MSVERRSLQTEQLAAGFGDANHLPAVDPLGAKQAAVVGIFPDRKTRTGGSPGVEHFFISALARRHEFEKVENQRFQMATLQAL